jgi:hypothetical protein
MGATGAGGVCCPVWMPCSRSVPSSGWMLCGGAVQYFMSKSGCQVPKRLICGTLIPAKVPTAEWKDHEHQYQQHLGSVLGFELKWTA